jgi:predicted amidohydrolase
VLGNPVVRAYTIQFPKRIITYYSEWIGRKWYAKYYESAVQVPSPEFQVLSDTAKENGVFLHIGIIERDGGTLYCSTLLFGKDGFLLSKHRKVVSCGRHF